MLLRRSKFKMVGMQGAAVKYGSSWGSARFPVFSSASSKLSLARILHTRSLLVQTHNDMFTPKYFQFIPEEKWGVHKMHSN